MMGAVHLLPGTTFSSVSEKGSYASEERASLTLAELERWLALQIAGVYHSRSIPLSERLLLQLGKKMLKQPPDPAIPSTKQSFF